MTTWRGRSGPRRAAVTEAERAALARILLADTAANCAEGRHRRTETDAETGNEVCRYCGAIVE